MSELCKLEYLFISKQVINILCALGTGSEFSIQGTHVCLYICIYSTQDNVQSGLTSQRPLAAGTATAIY